MTVPLGDWERLPTVFNSGVDANGAVLAPGSADPHYWLRLLRPIDAPASGHTGHGHPKPSRLGGQ